MTNKIHITGKYYFTADDAQYTLLECGERNRIEFKTKKKMDEMVSYETILGYYSSLYAMIKAVKAKYLRERISLGEVSTLNDVLNIIKDMNEKEEKLLAKLKDY